MTLFDVWFVDKNKNEVIGCKLAFCPTDDELALASVGVMKKYKSVTGLCVRKLGKGPIKFYDLSATRRLLQ